MKVELYHPSKELRYLARKEKNSLIATRIRAVHLALQKKDAPEIAAVLGYSRRTIQNWVYAYNREGLAGLNDAAGRGKKARLNCDQIQWLRQRIDQGPTKDDGICAFHSADIGRIIYRQFGIRYKVRSVQKLLRKLGYRYISGRPEHPKGDPAAREAFKKTSVIRFGKSVLTILENK